MKTVDQLTAVLQTETDLAAQLLQILDEKQQALILCDAEAVAAILLRERELLKPIKEYERERIRIVADFMREEKGLRAESGNVSIKDLASFVQSEASEKLLKAAELLKFTAGRIQSKNHQNRLLLESSARFVRHTLRILTQDYTRQLVDQKI
jgi:hypothetical protein